MALADVDLHRWLNDYRTANAALLEADPEFGRWLVEEYTPIGGAWQY